MYKKLKTIAEDDFCSIASILVEPGAQNKRKDPKAMVAAMNLQNVGISTP